MKFNDEYMELLRKFVEQQYNCSDEDSSIKEEDGIVWAPADSEAKMKIKNHINIFIDFTNYKKDKVKSILMDSNRAVECIRVNNFMVKIRNRYKDSVNISIYEEKFKTPSGNSCKMTYPIDLKDSRFSSFSHIKHNQSSITIDSLVEIIKYLQIISKFPVFS